MSGDYRMLHAEAIVADTHNDLLCAVVARPPERWGAFFAERWLPQLRDGGVDLQVLPIFIDDSYRHEGALRQTMRMIECAHRIAEANADAVSLCGTGEQVDAALARGQLALVLALESAPGVGENVELLQTMFRLGVRVASLAHFGRTPLADGSAEDSAGSRLTRAGVDALQLMEELGIMLDVSHLGIGGLAHALELSTRPVIATHSSARALRNHHRNLTDDQLRGVRDTGGVVCVNFFAPFLDETDQTIDRLVDHMEHIVGVTGVEHVGIGPDFVEEVMADTVPQCVTEEFLDAGAGISEITYLPGLSGPAGLPLVTDALVRRGWSETDIRAVLGGNVLRLFRAELGRSR